MGPPTFNYFRAKTAGPEPADESESCCTNKITNVKLNRGCTKIGRIRRAVRERRCLNFYRKDKRPARTTHKTVSENEPYFFPPLLYLYKSSIKSWIGAVSLAKSAPEWRYRSCDGKAEKGSHQGPPGPLPGHYRVW